MPEGSSFDLWQVRVILLFTQLYAALRAIRLHILGIPETLQGGKAYGTSCFPHPYSAEVNNAWSHNFCPPNSITACTRRTLLLPARYRFLCSVTRMQSEFRGDVGHATSAVCTAFATATHEMVARTATINMWRRPLGSSGANFWWWCNSFRRQWTLSSSLSYRLDMQGMK
jgi:hypothetical protein